MSEMHETVGPLGIIIPDPDQGTPFIHLQFTMPSTALMVWERFEDGTPGGHNLLGFCRRWAAFATSGEPFLQAEDPRFGHPLMIPRSAIEHVAGISVQYHRREDVRAGHRGGLAVPGAPAVVPMGNGTYEMRIPR